MPDPVIIDDLHVEGDLTVGGLAEPSDASVDSTHFSPAAGIQRAKLAQDATERYAIPLESFRVWDSLSSMLPTTSAADDLTLEGAAATSSPYLSTGDVKAAGAVTRYARALFSVPPAYDAFNTMNIVSNAGMKTTIADFTATIDFALHRCTRTANTVSADLITTAAQTINSLTFGEDSFTVTVTDMLPGDMLDLRVTIATNDAATGTTVEAACGAIYLECDIRG